MSHRVGDVTFT